VRSWPQLQHCARALLVLIVAGLLLLLLSTSYETFIDLAERKGDNLNVHVFGGDPGNYAVLFASTSTKILLPEQDSWPKTIAKYKEWLASKPGVVIIDVVPCLEMQDSFRLSLSRLPENAGKYYYQVYTLEVPTYGHSATSVYTIATLDVTSVILESKPYRVHVDPNPMLFMLIAVFSQYALPVVGLALIVTILLLHYRQRTSKPRA
jgi:hypothetical protein